MSKRTRRLEARVEVLESDARTIWAELLKLRGKAGEQTTHADDSDDDRLHIIPGGGWRGAAASKAMAPVRSPDPCETLITWGETPGTTKNG